MLKHKNTYLKLHQLSASQEKIPSNLPGRAAMVSAFALLNVLSMDAAATPSASSPVTGGTGNTDSIPLDHF